MKCRRADGEPVTHFHDVPDVVFGPIAILAGVLVVGIAWHFGSNVKAMAATERSDAGTVPGTGLVEVAGRVHDVPEPLTAPVSGDECVSYTLSVEEYRRDDELTKEWVDVERIERATAFVLTDDTGTVTVDPDDPTDFRCDVDRPEHASLEVDERESPALEATLEDPGDAEYPRRYREERLPTTADLYVLGTATDRGNRIENRGGDPFVVSTGSPRRTLVRHAAYSLLAGGVGVGLVAWGTTLLLGSLGLR